MEQLDQNILYSDWEFRKVLFLYQKILNLLLREVPSLKKDLNIKGSYSIVNIKRWLNDWSKQVFWDYLAAPHWNIEEMLKNQFNKDSSFRCIKIIFNSGQSIVLINNPKIRIDEESGENQVVWLPEGVLCLDNYRKKLQGLKEEEFYKYYFELNKIERKHFSWKTYLDSIWKILGSKKDHIVDKSKDKLALALNLQYE